MCSLILGRNLTQYRHNVSASVEMFSQANGGNEWKWDGSRKNLTKESSSVYT